MRQDRTDDAVTLAAIVAAARAPSMFLLVTATEADQVSYASELQRLLEGFYGLQVTQLHATLLHRSDWEASLLLRETSSPTVIFWMGLGAQGDAVLRQRLGLLNERRQWLLTQFPTVMWCFWVSARLLAVVAEVAPDVSTVASTHTVGPGPFQLPPEVVAKLLRTYELKYDLSTEAFIDLWRSNRVPDSIAEGDRATWVALAGQASRTEHVGF